MVIQNSSLGNFILEKAPHLSPVYGTQLKTFWSKVTATSAPSRVPWDEADVAVTLEPKKVLPGGA